MTRRLLDREQITKYIRDVIIAKIITRVVGEEEKEIEAEKAAKKEKRLVSVLLT